MSLMKWPIALLLAVIVVAAPAEADQQTSAWDQKVADDSKPATALHVEPAPDGGDTVILPETSQYGVRAAVGEHGRVSTQCQRLGTVNQARDHLK